MGACTGNGCTKNPLEKEQGEKTNEGQKIVYHNELAFGDQLLTKVTQKKMKNIQHRHIVAIICRMGKKDSLRGTGLLISKNMVLTCAHNVVYKKKDVDKINIEIHINPQGILGKFYRVESIYVPKRFYNAGQNQNQSFFYDYALIKLEEKVGTENNFIRLKALDQFSQEQRQEMELSIFGYPFKNYNQIGNQQQQVFQSGTVKSGHIQKIDLKEQLILHKISTYKGHSGSPIIQIIEKNKEIAVIAIHQAGIETNSGKPIANEGRLITEDLLKILERQVKNLGGQMFQVYSQESTNILDAYFKKQNPQNQMNQTLSIQQWIKRGDRFFKENSFWSARQCYRKVTSMNPYHSQAYYNMGLTFEGDSNLACAIQAYERAVKINSHNSQAYYSLGSCYERSHDIPAAKRCYLECLRSDPQHENAKISLSKLGYN